MQPSEETLSRLLRAGFFVFAFLIGTLGVSSALDRVNFFHGLITQDSWLNTVQRNVQTELATGLLDALGGTTTGFYRNLTISAGSGMNVTVAPSVLNTRGSVYQYLANDTTIFGVNPLYALPPDPTLGMQHGMSSTTSSPLSVPAPSTSGYSQCYLIEAQLQYVDQSPQIAPFLTDAGSIFNTSANRDRANTIIYQVKAGVAGSGFSCSGNAPSADVGWVAIGTVITTQGQSQVVGGNITASAPWSGFALASSGCNASPCAFLNTTNNGYIEAGTSVPAGLASGDLAASESATCGKLILGGATTSKAIDLGCTTSGVFTLAAPLTLVAGNTLNANSVTLSANASLPANSSVFIANDNAATNGLQFNVPTSSTNGFNFTVGGVSQGSLSNAGVFTALGAGIFGGSVTYTASASTPANSSVWCANDNAATKGLECNVPTGSTNGWQLLVNGVQKAQIDNTGKGFFANLNDSGLAPNSITCTDGSKNLTTTGCSSGLSGPYIVRNTGTGSNVTVTTGSQGTVVPSISILLGSSPNTKWFVAIRCRVAVNYATAASGITPFGVASTTAASANATATFYNASGTHSGNITNVVADASLNAPAAGSTYSSTEAVYTGDYNSSYGSVSASCVVYNPTSGSLTASGTMDIIAYSI